MPGRSLDDIFGDGPVVPNSHKEVPSSRDIKKKYKPDIFLWFPLARTDLDVILSIVVTNQFDVLIEIRKYGIIKSRIHYNQQNEEIGIKWDSLKRDINSLLRERASDDTRPIEQVLFSILLSNEERIQKLINGIANGHSLESIKDFIKNMDDLESFYEEIDDKRSTSEIPLHTEIDSTRTCSLELIKKNKDLTSIRDAKEIGIKLNADNLIEHTTEKLLENNHFLTFEESREIYYYKNGVYTYGGDIFIEKEVERICGYKVSNKHITEIKGHIARRTYHKRDELDANLNIINLQNGLYAIDKNELLPHSPNYLSINQKPIMYDPKAKALMFGKFLKDVLYSSEIRTAVEAMAYTFYRDCPFEHFFKLFGYGSNGKSVFTGLLSSMHDTRNVSNVPISSLVDNRFAISDLEFKDVNIDTELPNISIKDTSNLKKLTGGRKQPTRIERKNQKAYDTYLHAKLFFNTNSISETVDQTAAYYRREIIISFPNTFEGTGKDDPYLLKKLSSEQEMSGIFNIMMIALRSLLRRNGLYLNEKTIEERREKYEKAVNPIRAFLDEAISEESVESDMVTKDDMYDAYVKYCKQNKIAIKQKESLGKELKKNGIEDGRLGVEIDGKRKTCWKGVRLRPEYEKVIEMNLVMTSGTS